MANLIDYLGLISTPSPIPAGGDMVRRSLAGGWETFNPGSIGDLLTVGLDGLPAWKPNQSASTVADSLRTYVLNIPNGVGLRDLFSVMDAPFGANGNTHQVTNGTMVDSTHFSTPSYIFTGADVGKRIEIKGAKSTGTNIQSGTPAPLYTTIKSVAGGVAELNNAGDATPTPGTAWAIFGDSDTTAIQDAQDELSAAGGGVLVLPPNRGFLIDRVIPRSNIIIWAWGSTIYCTSSANGTAEGNNMGFTAQAGDPSVTGWQLMGATMRSNGLLHTTGTTSPISITGIAGATGLWVHGCSFYDFLSGGITFWVGANSQVTNNRLFRCGSQGLAGPNVWTGNAINMFLDLTVPENTDLLVHGNYIEECPTIGIDTGTLGGVSRTSLSRRVIVTGNRIISKLGGLSYGHSGINLEGGGGGAGPGQAKFVITGNIIDLADVSDGIIVSNGGGGFTRHVNIYGNDITVTRNGISGSGVEHFKATNNVVESGLAGITMGATNLAAISCTVDPTSPNVLNSISYPTTNMPLVRGSMLSPTTGIAAGSYITAGLMPQTSVVGAQTLGSTLKVDSTEDFPSSGALIVAGISGTVTYSAATHNTFTITGGSGTVVDNAAVTFAATVNGTQTLATTGATLTVNSTAGYASSGMINVPGIGDITYTGITDTSFTGCASAGGTVTNGAAVTSRSWQLNQPLSGTPTTVQALPVNRHVDISNNEITQWRESSGVGTAGALVMTKMMHSKVSDNQINYGAATTVSEHAISLSYLAHCDITDNKVTNAPRSGIYGVNSRRMNIKKNHIINPGSQTGATSEYGIWLQSCWDADIDDNKILATISSALNVGINVDSLGGGRHRARRNTVEGAYNTSPLLSPLSSFIDVRDNCTPAATAIVAARSNGVTLPTGTVYVESTVGFRPQGGTVRVGTDSFNYTGLTPTSFTGCTGGTTTLTVGTVLTNNASSNPEGTSTITPSGSPFTYKNTKPYPAHLSAYGGTLTQVEVARLGENFFIVQQVSSGVAPGGMFRLEPGDSAKLTYSGAAPVVHLHPIAGGTA